MNGGKLVVVTVLCDKSVNQNHFHNTSDQLKLSVWVTSGNCDCFDN